MTFGGFLPPHSRGFQGAEGFNTPEGGPKFSIEALTGMRAWRVNQDGSLISPVYTGFVWGAGDNVAVHGDGTRRFEVSVSGMTTEQTDDHDQQGEP